MKPVEQKRTLISSGVEEQASFGISVADQAHIMRILRDQLYSDRILAVLREYASNAWDANRMAGRMDDPIEVDLPSSLQPSLCIRDVGPGLSRDDVFKVYTQYGASTKRDTNVAVGMLGIGSKSAFSYTSSFTITSWHGGTKSVYNATLDERDVGVIQLLHEEPCGSQTGVEIKVPVKSSDFIEFRSKSQELFRYFKPLPKFNMDLRLEEPSAFNYTNGSIYYSDNNVEYVGVLGCIPYRISGDEFNRAIKTLPVLRQCDDVRLNFDIGEAEFSANREELKYSERTRVAIYRRAKLLAEEIEKDIAGIWSATNATQWEKRRTIENFSKAGISTDQLYKSLKIDRAPRVEFKTFEQKFERLVPNDDLCFIIRDDWRSLEGFNLPHNMQQKKRTDRIYLITPLKRKENLEAKPPVTALSFTPKETYDEIVRVLKEKEFEGVSVKFISDFTWTKPFKPNKPAVLNLKHAESVFVYNGSKSSTGSANWNIESVVPSIDDVFVILDRFIPQEIGEDYASVFDTDKQLCALLGRPFARIIGYKSTSRKPVIKDNCKGMHYLQWRQKLHEACLADKKIIRMIDDIQWSKRYYSYSRNLWFDHMERELKRFGVNSKNVVVRFLISGREAFDRANADRAHEPVLSRITPNDFSSEVDRLSDEIGNLYPLMGRGWLSDIRSKASDGEEHWAEYIRLKDEQRDRNANVGPTAVQLDRVV